MVLDLRLVKIGCRETINFFLHLHEENRERGMSLPRFIKEQNNTTTHFFENQLKLHSPHILKSQSYTTFCPAMQDVYGWLVDEPCPTDPWRTCPRVRTCLAPDAPASRPRRGCITTQTRLRLGPRALTIIIQGFLSPLPTFQHTNESAIRRREGTIKKGDVSFRYHDTSPTSYPIV